MCPASQGGGATPLQGPQSLHLPRTPPRLPLLPPGELGPPPLQELSLGLQGGPLQVGPGQHAGQRQGVVQLRELPEGPGGQGRGQALLQGESQTVAGLRDRSQQPRHRH